MGIKSDAEGVQVAKARKCLESETVSAKKIEYLLQFFDEKGDVVADVLEAKSDFFYKSVLKSLQQM